MRSILTLRPSPLLLLAAALVALAVLAVHDTRPAAAAAPQSKPWIYSYATAHLGFQLYWLDGFISAEPDASVTGYDVEYRETGAMSWTSHPHSGTVRAVEISNLTAGQAYEVRVRATNSDGDGPWSNVESVAAVVSRPATPNPPFPVSVEAGDAQASVTWGRPSHTGGRTLTGYQIRLYLQSSTTPSRTITVRGATSTSASISGLTNDVDYQIDMYATYEGPEGEETGLGTAYVEFTPTASQNGREYEIVVRPTTLAIGSETGSATFAAALTDDPGGSATVNLVKTHYYQSDIGSPGHVWDLNAVTLSTSQLTFTSSNYSDPQTVTVTGLPDGDDAPDQLVILILGATTQVSVLQFRGDLSPNAGAGAYYYDSFGNVVWDNDGDVDGDGQRDAWYLYGTYTRHNPVGDSSNSVSGVLVTVADDGRYGVPTNLRAVPERRGGEGFNTQWRLRLSWDAPVWPAGFTGDTTVTGYDVQWRPRDPDRADKRPAWTTRTVTATGTTTGYLGRTGEMYEYRVRARIAAGPLEWSPVATVNLDPPSTETAQQAQQEAANPYAELIAQIYEWRNDPEAQRWGRAHTDRWDRALKALGETVADPAITAMTADQAQALADQPWATRWVPVAEALRALEAAAQNPPPVAQQQQEPPSNQEPPGEPPGQPPEQSNRAPTLASPLADLSGLEAGTSREVSLSGVFSDPDGDALTITAASGDQAVATVSVSSGGASLTLSGVARGSATITVTARDPHGERVSDRFEVAVQPAPEPEPEPEPGAALSEVAARYDADGDGSIDVSEYRRAVDDYSAGKISYAELLEVVKAYSLR